MPKPIKSHSRQLMERSRAAVRSSSPYKVNGIVLGPEGMIQYAFFQWVDTYAPRFPQLALFHSIPNESKGGMDGAKRKMLGRRPGVPDTHLPIANDTYAGLWFEFKAPGEKASPVQKEWIAKLTEAGHLVVIADNWITPANITIDYLKLPLEHLT